MVILLVAWLLIQLLTVVRSNDRSPWGFVLMVIAIIGIVLWLLNCLGITHVVTCTAA